MQRRSWPNVINAVHEVRSGAIGDVFFSKCWYSNNRPSIGVGKVAAVPEWLDWELWQGPAPRVSNYNDNYLHYNWHWLYNWGTGEAGNNRSEEHTSELQSRPHLVGRLRHQRAE